MDDWKSKGGILIKDGKKIKEMNPNAVPKKKDTLPNLDPAEMGEGELMGAILGGANIPISEQKYFEEQNYRYTVDLLIFRSVQALMYHYCRKNGINPVVHREEIAKRIKGRKEFKT